MYISVHIKCTKQSYSKHRNFTSLKCSISLPNIEFFEKGHDIIDLSHALCYALVLFLPYSGGMPCFLRPPVLPDADSSADYTPMSDIYGQEQNNFQGTPVMGWTSPPSAADTAPNVIKTDMHPVGSYPWKPERPYLEPLEISVSVPPQLPPRADKRFKDHESRRKKPRSVLLQSRDDKTDTVAAEPYAVIPIRKNAEPKTESTTAKSGSVSRDQSIRRAPHIYDEIDFAETSITESEMKAKGLIVPPQGSRPESEEESPYAEPNIDSDDAEVNIPNCMVTPPPLPPRAPSMTPPCSPKLASTSSPVHRDDDEYIEPEVIEHVKPNRSHSAPPSQIINVLNAFNSKNNYTNHPVSPTSPPKSPKSPKVAKEKKPKKGGTLYNLLRTFKKKSQAETARMTRILPEHIPSDDVSLYQNSVNKYHLDLPNVAEDAGSELQRRLSEKRSHSSRQGTLTRHRSLSPMDAYIDMYPNGRPLSNCDYYEPMQLQELRKQFLLEGDYDVPYVSPSPSPISDEERTDNSIGNTTDIPTLRRSKSESSLMVDESRRTSVLGVTLLTQLSQSTECVDMPENCDTVEAAKSDDHCDTIRAAKSVDQVDHSAAIEVKQPPVPPRPQKPPIGPKPQLKPKPSLPPKPNCMVTRPTVMPRTKASSQYGMPKLPPKPVANRSESKANRSEVTVNKTELTTHNDVVTRTNADIRVAEEVGDNDRKILKPLGKAPPPPPPKNYRSTSFVMVKKPPAAKGAYATTSPTSDGNKKDGSSSPVKSPTALADKTEEDRKKEEFGLVVELKESDDDELEQVEYAVDTANTTEQALTASTEVDGTVGVQESPIKKRE